MPPAVVKIFSVIFLFIAAINFLDFLFYKQSLGYILGGVGYSMMAIGYSRKQKLQFMIIVGIGTILALGSIIL